MAHQLHGEFRLGTAGTHGTLLERTRYVIAAAALIAALAVAALVLRPGTGRPGAALEPTQAGQLAWPVPGSRDSITVEVLNGTDREGLAVDVTRLLRSRGIDVVAIGNARESSERTRVLARRGDVDAARRVARALEQGQPELEPDSLRFVDVTVIIGADFATELPLHP